MVFSFLELTTRVWHDNFRTVPVPAEYGAVAQTPRGILAEYPLGYSDIYRLWQMRHGRALLNGAPPATTADEARVMLLDPAQKGTAQNLALLGVSAIGIHPGAHVDAEVRPSNPARDPGYRLVGRFADGASIWDVVATPAPALVTLPGGFLAPSRSADGFYGFPFVASGGVGLMEVRAKTAATVQLVFDAVPLGGTQRTLRVTDANNQVTFALSRRTHVSVTVSVPRGLSQLLLKIDPAPTSAADAVDISPPYTQATSRPARLQATLVSTNPGF
jgi:hypothetical protein